MLCLFEQIQIHKRYEFLQKQKQKFVEYDEDILFEIILVLWYNINIECRYSTMVSISASQAEDAGSIPVICSTFSCPRMASYSHLWALPFSKNCFRPFFWAIFEIQPSFLKYKVLPTTSIALA